LVFFFPPAIERPRTVLAAGMRVGAVHLRVGDVDLVAVAVVHRDADPIPRAEGHAGDRTIRVFHTQETGETGPLVDEHVALGELHREALAGRVVTQALAAGD